MISWTKKILITISAISDEKVNTKEKTKDCLIENYKSIGKFGSINNPIAKVTFEGKSFIVDANYMKQAMEKIIALNEI